MSRIGKKPVTVPAGVTITITDNNHVTVKGASTELAKQFDSQLTITQEGSEIVIGRSSEDKKVRALHGTTRALIANMIEGVTTGFSKGLELIGVGYRAQKQGSKLVLNVGFSHPVEFEPETGIEVEVPSNTSVIIKGADKEKVGALAANIRAIRPPEPYKGKGIRYVGEHVRRKEGKTGK
ncbi:50S ribosomal protein L6 [Brochothrix campestris]|uniref:Large ribosomal subunit protein uL6 n=1 Tax=Brochothrix campestris FSL F6-1037 TaxID=1265861 RepID=W7CVY3_9LIST|nr:50S ribosomal protein L6 [Brochothrix campestris]EUJ40815.1 50S ribosomal protein L6 [Brochothrix campestris FSL F6-1037]